MRLLISGYGGSAGHTAGIYDLNERRFIWESGIPRISFMCADEENGFLFGAGEHDDDGKVYLFTPDADVYRLSDTLAIPGGSLCHISYSPRCRLLAGACYGNGDIFAVSVLQNGTFGEILTYERQGGDCPEGTLSRAHCTVFSTDGLFMYAANIALDRLYAYAVTTGGLSAHGYTQLDKGVGPRHLLQIEDNVYVITEYSNEIIRLHADAPDRLRVIDRVSTLPDGFTEKSYCSTLCFLPAGPDFSGFLYAANRGANTVAVFKRERDGALINFQDCPCAGDWPRHIELVNAAGLAVANERSGRVSFCPINPADGTIGSERFSIPFEGASFVWGLRG